MPAIARAKRAVDRKTAIELLLSAISYLQGAGFNIRADNISAGLVILIEDAAIDAGGNVSEALPVLANESIATTGNENFASSGKLEG